jgi:hypothetical protein
VDKKREDVSPHGTPPQSPRNAKKPYVKPALTEYGSVAKLTRGAAGSVSDGGSGMMKMCL